MVYFANVGRVTVDDSLFPMMITTDHELWMEFFKAAITGTTASKEFSNPDKLAKWCGRVAEAAMKEAQSAGAARVLRARVPSEARQSGGKE